jgi:hypothetical protein
MRTLLVAVSALALTTGLTLPVHAAPPHKQPTPQTPLELKIVGPGFIRQGEEVKYEAILINRSSEPIVLASQEARLDFILTWTISDSSGRPLPQTPLLYCPVGGKGWYKDLTRRMKDSDIVVLKPGGKIEFSFDDISAFYLFPGRGRYQVTFAYSYTPPAFEGNAGSPVDGFDAKYDLAGLSPSTLENLRHAVPLGVTSKPAIMILQ